MLSIPRNDIATIHARRGRLDEALATFEKVRAIREASYPSGHPRLATIYENLGHIRSALGQHLEAERFLSRWRLASTLAEMGERDEALELFAPALTSYEAAFAAGELRRGPRRPRTGCASAACFEARADRRAASPEPCARPRKRRAWARMSPRAWYWVISIVVLSTIGVLALWWPPSLIAYLFAGPPFLLGIYDQFQTKHAILRNFPVIGHGRYLFETIRPEINQYFIESNTDGMPFDREQRSVVYQRAKDVNDTTPFGTQLDVYLPGYEWLDHSLAATHPSDEAARVMIGGRHCARPYSSSLLNISAMSYGSLSRNAIEALNRGAARGGFAHNTGEGGISPYHRAGGGDLVWQVGTGYFGCRSKTGGFDDQAFSERARLEQVKMIEVKLSQGAKPGHGGILPAAKLTREIAEIRGVPMGQDVLSPPCHSAFSCPTTLLRYVARLRELSEGKPVGFKLCVGKRSEFLAICKAMIETGIEPDFITIDGAEGGTGAAPLEFSNRVGMPLTEGLVFAHNALRGAGLRERLTLLCSGKILSGFDMARALAIGADGCNSARAMMFAVGCIQAKRCNHNDCPTGVATQKPYLVKGLDVEDKAERVHRYHNNTIRAFLELLGAAGFRDPSELMPWHIHRRLDFRRSLHYGELFHYLEPNELLDGTPAGEWSSLWDQARADGFAPVRAGSAAALAESAAASMSAPEVPG